MNDTEKKCLVESYKFLEEMGKSLGIVLDQPFMQTYGASMLGQIAADNYRTCVSSHKEINPKEAPSK